MSGAVVQHILENPGDFKKLTDAIKKDISTAAIRTVNIVAANSRKALIEESKRKFHIRNNYTERQTQYTQMPLKPVNSLEEITSRVGYTQKAEYMARQDQGGEHIAKNNYLRIPTDKARGGDKASLVQKIFTLRQLKRMKVQGSF